jgi:hypothetical protein
MLTVRERLEALEGLADIARRFGEIRARGGFVSVSSAGHTRDSGSIAHPSSSDSGK